MKWESSFFSSVSVQGKVNFSRGIRHIFFSSEVLIFFLFLHKNICCGYSLEVPQHMFLWRNKKNMETLLMSTQNIYFPGEK